MRVIAGLARGHKLKATEDYDIRPTSDRAKEALFSTINDQLHNAYFLDIFSGSGSIAIEALSRGAEFCAFIEQNKKHYEIINENIEHVKKAIGDIKYTVLNDSFEDGLLKLGKYKFDIIFMDPPYGKNLVNPALSLIRKGNLLKNSGILIVEQAHNEDEVCHEDYEVIKVRKYGKTNLYFLQYN